MGSFSAFSLATSYILFRLWNPFITFFWSNLELAVVSWSPALGKDSAVLPFLALAAVLYISWQIESDRAHGNLTAQYLRRIWPISCICTELAHQLCVSVPTLCGLIGPEFSESSSLVDQLGLQMLGHLVQSGL